MATYHVYIVRCRDNSLYTGWTTDITTRISQHNAGKGAKYTRSRRPVTLVYSAIHPSQTEAMRQERQIKKLTRAQKITLIETTTPSTANL